MYGCIQTGSRQANQIGKNITFHNLLAPPNISSVLRDILNNTGRKSLAIPQNEIFLHFLFLYSFHSIRDHAMHHWKGLGTTRLFWFRQILHHSFCHEQRKLFRKKHIFTFSASYRIYCVTDTWLTSGHLEVVTTDLLSGVWENFQEKSACTIAFKLLMPWWTSSQ